MMAAIAKDRPAGHGPARTRRLKLRAAGWLGVAVAAGAWQLLAMALHQVILPTFSTAMAAVGHILTGPQLTQDILTSVVRALIGFAISAAAGITIGLTLGYVRRLGDYCVTVIDFLRSLPAPLFVPLAIVVLGLGDAMVVSIVVSAAVWPVLLNSFDAARRIEPLYLDTARACGLRGVALFRLVLLPATLPMVFAGLRIALSTSLAVLVVAEILGAHSGIGFFIQDAQQTFRVPDTYAGVIILAAIGWLFDTAFLFLERRLLRWESALTGDAHV